MKKVNYLFTNKDLKKLIIPLVLEQALAITVGMADTMMISSVGEVAVSGVSLVDMINNLLFNLLAALSTGGAVVVSQHVGAQDMKGARKAAKQLLYTVISFGTVMALGAVIFRHPLLNLFFGKIEPDVMSAGLLYLAISAVSYPFLGMYNACAALYRSMGKANVTFNVSIIGNLINVVGNAIGIFVLHAGVAGVAVPSLISRALMGILLFLMLQNPELMIHFEKEKIHFDWKMIRKILYIGIPSGIESGLFQLGRVLVVSIISGFGTIQIAANGVANSLDGVGIIPGQALNLAMITVIGTCVGADDKEQIKYYTKKIVGIAYLLTAAVIIPLLWKLDFVLSFFGLAEETLRLTKILVMIHNGCAMVLWPVAFVLPNMLRACNDVRYTMVVSIFSMCAFRIGFSIIIGIHFGMGAIGVWIAMIIDWVFRTIFFVGRYLHGDWKKTMYRLKG